MKKLLAVALGALVVSATANQIGMCKGIWDIPN